MAKQMSKLGIMNAMGDAAHKKARKMSAPLEGSPEEEASESPEEAKAEGDYSPAAQKSIGSKMHKMKDEDKPQDQKVAIAMSEARKKGLKVPKAK
jgi:hypothetical protein